MPPEKELNLTSFSKKELQLMLELLTKVNFPSAEAKLLAGNLQAKIEAQLSEQAQ